MLLRDAADILQSEGPLELFKRSFVKVYRDGVRPLLPKHQRTVLFNGVEARTGDVCRVDPYVPWYEEPWYNRDDPEYEAPLLAALRKNVANGDEVVILGGGWGVSAVTAAKIVGQNGHVTVYEGAQKRISDIEGTLKLNGVADRVTVIHAIVGEPVQLTGAPGSAEVVDPRKVPSSDVLEMDCEGAETEIIPNLDDYPPVLIVETHRNEPTVRDQLNEVGYEIIDRGVEKEGEIFILTAKRV